MIHIMIDGETPDSNAATTSFLTLAAVPFDPVAGQLLTPDQYFYRRCALEDLLLQGFTISKDTIEWWSKQSDVAKDEAFGGRDPIGLLWAEFVSWCAALKETHGDIIVWGNGADFDNVICQNSLKRLGFQVPWSYKNNRCFRTLKELFPEIPIVYEGIKHTAINDACNQALHAIKCLRALEAGKVK